MEINDAIVREELLEALVDEVRSRLPEEERDPAAALTRRAFAHVPPEELLDTPREDEAAALTSLWRLGRARRPRELALRVMNPSAEREGWTSAHTVIQIVNDDMSFLLASISGELHRR